MENESEKEETVTLTHGTDIFHGYQVINTQTPVAKIIYIFGAPSPPIIILSQAQRNDEGHHSHSWIKSLAEKFFRRKHSSQEPHHEKNSYFNNENTNRNQAHIYIMNNYINFSNCVIINNGINQHENENHEQKEDSKSESASDKDDHEATVECVKTETTPPQEPLSNVPPKTVKDYSHSPLKPFFADQRIADIALDLLHELIDNADSSKAKIMPIRAISEIGCFISRIPYKVYISEFGHIAKASFYHWMKFSFAKDPSEIDALIAQISNKLPHFS